MDTVELIIRTEELFAIDLPDRECGQVVTVGDLYRLVLDKLGLAYESPDSFAITQHASSQGSSRLHKAFPGLTPWTQPDVWATLRDIIHDQLQIDLKDIRGHSTFTDDLRCN